ncbi:MAG: hypothetical protein AAF289_12100 [Cyanobacteria bacterium P01_A01_bin.135]
MSSKSPGVTAATGTLVVGIFTLGIPTTAEAAPPETLLPQAPLPDVDGAVDPAIAPTASSAAVVAQPETIPPSFLPTLEAAAAPTQLTVPEPVRPDASPSPEFSPPAEVSNSAADLRLQAPPAIAPPETLIVPPAPTTATAIAPAPNPTAIAPENLPEGTGKPSDTAPATPTPEDPDYLVPPRPTDGAQINPLTTTFLLNDVAIDHLTDWDVVFSEQFADTTEGTPSGSGTVTLNSRITESLTTDNVYTVDQRGSYLQLRSLPHQRTVTTTRRVPQTMTGLQLQMTLTGACILPNSESQNSQDQCSYIPGLITVRDSIDPDFFIPTQVRQPSSVGDVVTPESLAAIRQPGFQRGANGKEIGLDLYFPNIGAFPGNTQDVTTDIERREILNNTAAGSFSRVRQVVQANDTEAVLGRTIRGFSVLADDDNRLANTATQAIAQALPEYVPQLEGSSNPANTNINRNLFLAANNARLPGGSLTVYSVGRARAESLTPDITELSQVPAARYNGLWLGLSPVIDRSIETGGVRFEPTGPQRLITSGGGEGGGDADVELISVVNDDIFTNSNIQDSYAQIYLDVFQQDIDSVTQQIYREDTTYYPHLSYTGNITNSRSLLRYYTGVITSDTLRAYLGADYTRNAGNWLFRVGGVGYLNPDRDYYSQLWGSVTRSIRLGDRANLVLGTNVNYALDRSDRIGDIVSNSPASILSADARLNLGQFSLGLTHVFGDVLPNSYEDSLVVDTALRLNDRVRLTAYVAPIDDNSSSSPIGAGLQWRLGDRPTAPSLAFNWQNQRYNYGPNELGNELVVKDNVFTLTVRAGGR